MRTICTMFTWADKTSNHFMCSPIALFSRLSPKYGFLFLRWRICRCKWVIFICKQFHKKTRMHFSRMRTARFNGRLGEGCVSPWADTLRQTTPWAHPQPWADTPWQTPPAPLHVGIHPQWTEGMTHACENITFLQLLLRAVKNQWWFGNLEYSCHILYVIWNLI